MHMDQMVERRPSERRASTAALIAHVVAAIDAAAVVPEPFDHLEFGNIFPDDVYAAMLDALPRANAYRPMHGRSKGNDLADGTHTRVKIDLFPEYIRHQSPPQRAIWHMVGDALCSEPVKEAFRRKLAPALAQRFGAGAQDVGLFPIPILTRDIPGYRITPHTDTHWKGITVQLYLPRDEANTDIGTIFHAVRPDGSLPKARQMKFAPNSGYAFAVDKHTWHSADPVHDRVETRDSILLTYFVDQGVLKVLRNRGKRLGNFLLNEFRARS